MPGNDDCSQKNIYNEHELHSKSYTEDSNLEKFKQIKSNYFEHENIIPVETSFQQPSMQDDKFLSNDPRVVFRSQINAYHQIHTNLENSSNFFSYHTPYKKSSLTFIDTPKTNSNILSNNDCNGVFRNKLKRHRRNLSAGNAPIFIDNYHSFDSSISGALQEVRRLYGESNQVKPVNGSHSLSNNVSYNKLRNTSSNKYTYAETRNSFSFEDIKYNGYQATASSGSLPSIWSLTCDDGNVYVGCSNGSIEVYNAYDGSIKCRVFYRPNHVNQNVPSSIDFNENSGITHLAIADSKLVVARLSGIVDIYSVNIVDIDPEDVVKCDSYSSPSRNVNFNLNNNEKLSHNFSSLNNLNNSHLIKDTQPNYRVWLTREASKKVHHQPISVLCCDNLKILTGSLDHTLKILNLSDASCVYTLHGHLAPITAATLGGASGFSTDAKDARGPSPSTGAPSSCVLEMSGVDTLVSGAQVTNFKQ